MHNPKSKKSEDNIYQTTEDNEETEGLAEKSVKVGEAVIVGIGVMVGDSVGCGVIVGYGVVGMSFGASVGLPVGGTGGQIVMGQLLGGFDGPVGGFVGLPSATSRS